VRSKLAVAAVICAALIPAPVYGAEAPPRRIVSINVCADQYLLAVVPRERIVALSPFSRDSGTSYFAELASGIPQVRDDAESVLQLRPDLVVASRFNNKLTLRLLRRQGLRVLALGHPTTLEQVRAQMVRVGEALGEPQTGAALAEAFEQKLQRTKDVMRDSDGDQLSAIYFDRGGYVLGPGSLSTAMLAHVGLRNAARDLGLGAMTPVSIETVLAARPELLIVPNRLRHSDQGAALLSHPALDRLYPPDRRVSFPVAAAVCPGPSLIPGLDALVKLLAQTVSSLR